MGFFDKAWDITKNVAKFSGNMLVEVSNNINEIKQECELMSDNELMDILKNKGPAPKKSIAFNLLKKRGFEVEELKKNFQP